MEIRFITQPYEVNGTPFFLGEKISQLLKSKKPLYNKVWLVSSFAKLSGIHKLKPSIKKAIKNEVEVNFILGINNHLTSAEALLEILGLGCKARIFRNTHGSSLGAKIFCFESGNDKADVFISSGNITEGGLYKNNELVVHISYDLINGDKDKYDAFKCSVSNFLDPKEDLANDLTEELINILIDNGEIISESEKKAGLKKREKKEAAEEQETSDIDLDLESLSIVLPTGDSIEVSLNAAEDLSEKLGIVNEEKGSVKKENSKEESEAQFDQVQEAGTIEDDFDIEIEGIDDLVSVSTQNVDKLAMDEVAEQDADGLKEDSDMNSQTEEAFFMNGYEVIDIEQMLYRQSHAGDLDEHSEERQPLSISEEDLMLIKARGTKKSTGRQKVQQEEIVEETPKETAKKKFIIASSFNKSNNGIINAFFIQINKLKGRGLSGEVRMPVASRDFSPEFWGWPNKYVLTQPQGKGNKKSKKWQVSCKVIDVENPSASQIDMIDLYQEEGKTSFNFYSQVLASLNPQENDIIRIIRCPEGSESVFQCELIRCASKEYSIWEQFCSQVIKGTERRYGFA